jgi:hypothetical protein
MPSTETDSGSVNGAVNLSLCLIKDFTIKTREEFEGQFRDT